MPRKGGRRGPGGRNSGGAARGNAQEPGSEVGSEEVLDSDVEVEAEYTERLEADQEGDEGDEETREATPQPGPSTKSKLTRGGGGKKQGKKPNLGNNTLGPDEMVNLNRISEVIDDVMKFLSDTAKLVLPLLEGKDKAKEKKKTLKRLHDIGVQMIESQEKVKVVPEAVMSAYNNLDLEELVDKEQDLEQLIALLNEFDEAATKEMEKRNKKVGMKVVYQNDTYQKFLEVLDQFYDRGGKGKKAEEDMAKEDPGPSAANFGACSEGIEALSEYIPTTDPFTRQTLKDPYENKICKHVYEYQSVMDMVITSGGKTRCPYPGCSNKKYIQVEDLLKNVHVAAKIAARIRQEKDGMFDCMTVD